MKAVEKGEQRNGMLLPTLPEGYAWDTADGDYNIYSVSRRVPNGASGLICYIRPSVRLFDNKNIIRAYVTDHKEQHFDNLQDAIDVMAAKFTLGLYFQDET